MHSLPNPRAGFDRRPARTVFRRNHRLSAWIATAAMRRRFALVYNATAGVARPRLLDGVIAALKQAGGEVFQLGARTAAEASARVREAAQNTAADAVIAAGGDGTFRAVAAGAAGTALPVGVVPLGTGNVIAHELGLPRPSAQIASVLRSGPVIEASGGVVNGAPFFLMTGAGFDGQIVSKLNYRTKRALGRLAYAAPVLATLTEGPRSFDAEIDGQTFEASWVIITNASRYGGSFRLTNKTRVGADGLIAVVVEARSRVQLASASISLGLGRLIDPATRPRYVRVIPCQHARLGITSKAAAEIDGDASGSTPLEVHAGGPTVRLIVPAGYVAASTNRHANHVLSKL